MQDIALGLLAVLVGVLLCFGGALFMRFVISVWGAFAGFNVGAGLVAGIGDERFLGSVLAWVVGLVFALVFALFAYLYYAIGVVIAMASIGFALGAGLIVALGMDWSWLVILAGVVVGIVFAAAAVLSDLPALLLVLFSSIAGASVVTAGVMLLAGAMDSADLTDNAFASRVEDEWYWYALFLVLAVAGAVAQLQDAAVRRRGIRDGWSVAE